MTDAADSTASPDARIGEIVNEKYRIDGLLGEGGMGAVYVGEHTLIGRKVAIKLLKPEIAQDEDVLHRFQREARSATSIGHDHIVDVTDMGKLDDGSAFMVLEYLDGRELGDDMKDGAISVRRMVHIMAQVCDALSAAHAKGIVHRDLKPANIFLIEKGRDKDYVKVLDFGIAKAYGEGDKTENLTQTGTALGTPAYMSPEQAQNVKSVDHRSDLYALGVIIFEMLAARRPFLGDSFVNLMVSVVCDAPPALATLRPDLPKELTDLVDRQLSKDPSERVQDCETLAKMLASFVDQDEEAEEAPVALPASEERTSAPKRPASMDDSGTAPTAAAPAAQGTAPTVPGVAAAIPQTVVAAGVQPVAATSSDSVPAVTAVAPATPTAPPSRKSPLPLIGGIVVVVLALVGVAAFSGVFGGGEPSTAAGADRQPGDGPSEGPAKQRDDGPTVRVQIETEPSNADLFLDGSRIANPFDAELPQQTEPRLVEARLEGHKTVSESISLRFAQKVRLELASLTKTAEPTAAPETETPRSKTTSSKRRQPSKTTKAADPPAAETAKAPPTPEEPTPEPETEPEPTPAKTPDSPLKQVTF